MKELDTVKIILAASFVFCLAGLALYFYQDYNLSQLKRDLPKAKTILKDIGVLSAKIDARNEMIEKDQRLQQGLKLREYLETQAHKANITYNQYLQVSSESEEEKKREGYVDKPHSIIGIKNRKFSRYNIARYILYIENETNQLKVTELGIDKPNETRENWSLKMKIKERKSLGGK